MAYPPPLLSSSKTLTCTYECLRYAGPGLDVLQKCYRRAEGIFEGKKKGLQEATPLTARQEEGLNGRGTKASWSRREEVAGGQNRTGLGESQEVGGSPGSGLAILTEGRRPVSRGWTRFRHSLPRRRGGPGVCAARRQTRVLPWAGCLAACAGPAWSWREERAAWRSRRPSPRKGHPAAGAGPPCRPVRPAAGSQPWPCRRRMSSPWHCWFCWAERGGR